ncbi:MAG TPA: erythromycin esterase family protein [Thermoanaerobaculia bacterium]|nr:erythromycin esterase family protein [Thermoanaerobaculia bacterium]
MFRHAAALLLLLAVALDVPAARRRAVGAPGGEAFRVEPLHSVELVADTSDLASLRSIAGNASIVALGDATHGTHEFYTVKLRLVDFLVRQMGFDVLSLEAPFPITERLNVYVQTGEGDPRAILAELSGRLHYYFWDVEELLAAIEWMRAYNAHRGDAPPIELAGADIYDEGGGVAGVLAYLQRVDPTAAAYAEIQYSCVLAGQRTNGCEEAARRVYDALAARPESGTRDFEDALHYAAVVLQNFDPLMYEPRDRNMAANLLWIREHRGRARKVVHWGHQEHAGKTESPYVRGRTMGVLLSEQLGSGYVAIGTLTGSGTFLQWEVLAEDWVRTVESSFPDPEPGSWEERFRQRGHAAMLVPLRGLAGEATFRTAPTTPGWTAIAGSLSQKLDAVIYIDRTTPTKPCATLIPQTTTDL